MNNVDRFFYIFMLITAVIFLSEDPWDMARMFTPFLPKALNILPLIPGVAFHVVAYQVQRRISSLSTERDPLFSFLFRKQMPHQWLLWLQLHLLLLYLHKWNVPKNSA